MDGRTTSERTQKVVPKLPGMAEQWNKPAWSYSGWIDGDLQVKPPAFKWPTTTAIRQLSNESFPSENTGSRPIYRSERGSLSAGDHCASLSRGHLLCRVTHREERKPPECKSDMSDEHQEGQGWQRESERKRERLQALAGEVEKVN